MGEKESLIGHEGSTKQKKNEEGWRGPVARTWRLGERIIMPVSVSK